MRGVEHIDYVFAFGNRLADTLAKLLDKEHETGANTRLREELARRPDEDEGGSLERRKERVPKWRA